MTVAVDIGGTKIAAAQVVGNRVLERRQIATPRDGSADSLVEAVAGLLAGWRVPRIGVATTGLVQDGCLTAVNPATMSIPDRTPLRRLLTERLGAEVLLFNDAQAAAWGEHIAAGEEGASSFLFVTISTGIGGGLVLDGRLQIGAAGLAGHIGHMVVAPDGRPCGCGRRGCLEAIASGEAVVAQATALFGRPVKPAELIAMAREETRAARLLNEAASAVAGALGDLRMALGIETALIGGGLGLAEEMLDRIAQAVAALPLLARPGVRAARLGHDAGLIGIAALVDGETRQPGIRL
jgi:N-acylmannosamine kinase